MIFTLDSIAPFVRHVRLHHVSATVRSFIDPEYVFIYIKAGKGIYVVEGREYVIQAGDMVLMAPYMLHIVRSEPGQEMIECVIHFDLFYDPSRQGNVSDIPEMNFSRFAADRENPETLLADVPLSRTAVPESVQAGVYRQYEELRRSFMEEKQGTIRQLRERAAMLEILAYYLDQPAGTDSGSAERMHNWRNIERALTYIHEHYSRPVTLDEVSRQARISKTYFCSLFRQYTGIPVHRYINELRVYKAKHMMENSELSLTEIADAAGLGDIHAFSKTFRKYERISPSEYRAKQLNH